MNILRVWEKTINNVWQYILIASLLLVLAVAAALPAQPAWASGAAVKVWPGLAGLYKTDQTVQLKIEITNSGQPFDARLVVDRERIPGRSLDDNRVIYSREINVSTGKSVTAILVPGDLLGGQMEVTLDSGGVALARVPIQGTNVSGGMIGLVLSEKAYRSDLFSWLDKRLGNFNTKYIDPHELPDNALLLQLADLLVVDRETVASLTDKQVQAIREWTGLGGTLLLSGGAGAESGGKFSALSPVAVQGSTRVSGGLGGLRSGAKSLNAASGKLVTGQVVVSDAGTPVLARRDLDRGKVVYCAVNIEELTGNNEKLWLAMDEPVDTGVFSQREIKERSMMRNVLTDASSYLPQLKLPPVPLMMAIWVLYLAVAGPGLYLLLKRFDRRDLNWLLVPALALTTAGGFYLFSPVNRLQGYMAQTLTAVDILGRDLAEVRSAATIVMPRGGNLILQGATDMVVEPVNYFGDSSGQKGTEVVNTDRGSDVRFNGVEYGSMRQVAAYGLWRKAGHLDGSVYFRKGSILGNVTNRAGMDLRDCKLLAGGHLIELGNIAAGQTRRINEELDKWQLMSEPEAVMGGQEYPGQDNNIRERRLLSQIINQDNPRMDGILFMGWADSSPELFKVTEAGGAGKNYGLLLLRQNISIDYPAGEFTLPAGLLSPRVSQEEGGLENRPDGVIIHDGKAVLTYELADVMKGRKYAVTRIIFPASRGGGVNTIELYDWTSKSWVELKRGQKEITAPELSKYLSPSGSLQIRVSGRYRDEVAFKSGAFRGIEMEGVVE
ncbi:MAG: hypothetical protein VR69_17265 [Peptococcaceae bacterium BRH_c4b]|nr:MAG: hypothetical protein VR69_17265 [Peptococcaceae bacterium BRH_c4b]